MPYWERALILLNRDWDKSKHKRYYDVMSFVGRRVRVDLLRTCIISIRGYRGTRTLPPTAITDLDLNLINTPKS